MISPKKSGKARSSGGRVSLQMGKAEEEKAGGMARMEQPKQGNSETGLQYVLNHSQWGNDKPHIAGYASGINGVTHSVGFSLTSHSLAFHLSRCVTQLVV